jgi:phage baseplate assembly protein W
VSNEIVGRGWVFPLRTDLRGRVALTSDRSELDQAIKIILLTPPGQRVMRPSFGCRIHDLIFAPVNSQTMAQARRYVMEALAMWEPRIVVTEVVVRADDHRGGPGNCLLIEIEYQIKATHDQRSLVFPFYLIPDESPS